MWGISQTGQECRRSRYVPRGPQEGQNERNLALKNPDWRADAIGIQIYQFALIILRDMGSESNGRTINIPGASEFECESATWGFGDGWRSPAGSVCGFSRSMNVFSITRQRRRSKCMKYRRQSIERKQKGDRRHESEPQERDLLGVKRHDRHYRTHRMSNEQAPGLPCHGE